MKPLTNLASAALAALLVGCTCGDKPAEAPAPAATPTVAAEPTPAPDPFLAALASLREQAGALPSGEARAAAATALVDASRTLGNQAITDHRPDVVSGVAEILRGAGEAQFAGALLQRAKGLLDPATDGTAHLVTLAALRKEEGRLLDSASLLERALRVPPTTPELWIELSRVYSALDRPGPARAAVTRGLRQHADNVELTVQGAEVILLSGRPDQAIATLEPLLEAHPDHAGLKDAITRARTAKPAAAKAPATP